MIEGALGIVRSAETGGARVHTLMLFDRRNRVGSTILANVVGRQTVGFQVLRRGCRNWNRGIAYGCFARPLAAL